MFNEIGIIAVIAGAAYALWKIFITRPKLKKALVQNKIEKQVSIELAEYAERKLNEAESAIGDRKKSPSQKKQAIRDAKEASLKLKADLLGRLK